MSAWSPAIPETQIDRLLAVTAAAARSAAALEARQAVDMPWAEPPEQPTAFDRRDAEEAEDFAVRFTAPLSPVTANPHLFPLRRCSACGYRLNAPGHRSQCETP